MSNIQAWLLLLVCHLPNLLIKAQVSNKYGNERSRASVDLVLKNPSGDSFYTEEGLSDDELSVGAKGGRGPWLACFRVAKGRLLRPSVIVKITHFTVNYVELVGTDFEWQRRGAGSPGTADMDSSHLGEPNGAINNSRRFRSTTILNILFRLCREF